MSIADSKKVSRNPSGFPERLRVLMEGWGFTTRSLGDAADVSHGAIAKWLTDSNRAGLEEVARVASVFGWSGPELYNGEPGRDVMDRLAALEAFRERTRRLASSLAEAAVIAGELPPLRVSTLHRDVAPAFAPKAAEAGRATR